MRRRDDHRLWVYYELTRKGQRLLQADTPVRLQLAREPPVSHLPPLGPTIAVAGVALLVIAALGLPALQPSPAGPASQLAGAGSDWRGPSFALLSTTGGVALPAALGMVHALSGDDSDAYDHAYTASRGGAGGANNTTASGSAPAPSPTPASEAPASPSKTEGAALQGRSADGQVMFFDNRSVFWTGLLVEPVTPVAGETVTFDVLVLNPSNASAAGVVGLVVDGNTTVQRWFQLNASETSHLLVRGVFGPGAHTVRVDDTERVMWVAELRA